MFSIFDYSLGNSGSLVLDSKQYVHLTIICDGNKMKVGGNPRVSKIYEINSAGEAGIKEILWTLTFNNMQTYE
jgi:hypothetical protein